MKSINENTSSTKSNIVTKKSNASMNKSIRITVTYFLFGCLWIILTDSLTSAMYGKTSIELDIHILKGIFYILVTSALIFGLIYPTINKLVALKDSLQKTNLKLELSNKELYREIEKSNKIENTLLEAQRQARIGSFEYDISSNHLVYTDEGLRIHGLQRQCFSEKPDAIIQLIHPDDRTNVINLCQRAITEKIDVEYDCQMIKTNGEEIIVHVRFVPILDKNAECVRALGTVQDITERKRTEIALRESERSKSVLISHLPGMAYRCTYDSEWTMLFLSEGCYALTGYSSESLICNKALSYSDLICKEYKEVIWEEWTRAIATKEPFRYEYEITTANYVSKWVLEIGQGVFDDKGNLEALEGIVIDITESKQRLNQIQYMNDHDSLTGVYNRSYYEKAKLTLDKEENLPLTIIKADINGLRLTNDALGHTTGDFLIIKTGEIIKSCCGVRDILARTGGDEFSIISPNTNQDEAEKIRLSINKAFEEYSLSLRDKALVINLSLGYGVKQSKETYIDETEKQAEIYMDKRKLLEKKSHHNTILTSIMATMYARSNETEEHAQRLAQISKMIGEKMNLPQTSLDELQLFAMLHDIGKIGIDDRIMNKSESLNTEEWTAMKKHPEIGYMIATSSPEFAAVAEYILSHHERWDGTGYPYGLCGDKIPLLSRILAVADAYDAMTENRVYRKALPKKVAIEEIRKNSGKQFDPYIAKIFIENI